MKTVIVGAGALGTILAAHLVRARHDVCVVARGRRAEQLQQRGLEVCGLSDLHAACPIITDPASVPEAGLLIVTVKTYDNEAAVAPLAGDAYGAVFSVANGVLKNDELAQKFGTRSILGCMADTSGELLADGRSKFTRNVMLHLGSPGGGAGERASEVAAAINDAGINAQAVDHIDTVEWSKFVGWTALLALSVITRFRTAQFLADPKCAGIAARMIKEMGAIAQARNIAVIDQSPLPVASVIAAPPETAREVLQAVGQEWLVSAPEHRMSSLQDLERGKRLEVDETLGYAVGLAENLGLQAPTLAMAYELVAGINSAQG